MKKAFLYISLLLASIKNSFASDLASITILAPQNMSYALTEIIRNYSSKENIIITGSYNSLNNLIKDIEIGHAADIIITDHPIWIKDLKQKGLVNVASIDNLVEDKLVLVTSNNFYNLNRDNFDYIATKAQKRNFYKNFTIAIPSWYDDTVGLLAYKAISNIDYLSQEENQITIKEKPINYITEVNDSLAITKYTESFDNYEIKIIETIDKKHHPRFIYQIASIASENMAISEKFIKYIKSPESLNILKSYGFDIIE